MIYRNANILKVKDELKRVLGFQEDEVLLCSGKTGEGVPLLIEAVIDRIDAPKINNEEALQALIFDSYFDPYKGVVALIKVVSGEVHVGDTIQLMATESEFLDNGVRSSSSKRRENANFKKW